MKSKKTGIWYIVLIVILVAAVVGGHFLIHPSTQGDPNGQTEEKIRTLPSKWELESEEEDSEVMPYYPHVDKSLDFAALAAEETNKDYKEMAEYFASVVPSMENAVTGKYKDKNLIFLLCEAFSPYVVSEEYTPYLWKITHQGYAFNFYNTVPHNTNNSEFCAITSIYPDHSYRDKGWNAFYKSNPCSNSASTYLPYTFANSFNAAGGKSYYYHYNKGSYYQRNKSHANFGFETSFIGAGLEGVVRFPNYDLEMFEQAVPKLLTPGKDGKIQRFNAMFLTFGGHSVYQPANIVARRYSDFKNTLPYKSEKIKNYVAQHQDLEASVKLIYTSLEEAGILEDTIIIITPDHWPYGMDAGNFKNGLSILSELAGTDLNATAQDTFLNQYKGIFCIFDATMDELVEVEAPMCSYDITPTLLNLWGFEYDSRLLMGRDIFSDSEHVAVFYDFGFVAEDFFYNNSSKKAYTMDRQVGDETVQAKAKELVGKIAKKYGISKKMQKKDYFGHILKQGDN